MLGSHVGELLARGVRVYLREREEELIRMNPTKGADWEFYKKGNCRFQDHSFKIQTIYYYEKLGVMVSFQSLLISPLGILFYLLFMMTLVF